MQRTERSIEEEYTYALGQGLALIKQVKPVELSKQSIDHIHYWYRYAANLLIESGTPKHKVATKLYEDFEQFYGERWIRAILKEGGIELPEQESGINSENISSLNTVLPENEEYDSMLVDYESVIKALRAKMSKPFCSLIDPGEVKYCITTGKGMALMALNCLDERQITHVPLTNLFIQCAIKYTLANAYSHYYLKVKDIIKKMTAKDKIRGIRTMEAISSKQSHETVYLRIKEIHYSLEPTDEHEARAKGFSGEQCPKCKSWRTDRVPDSTQTGKWYRCVHCDHEFERTFIEPYEKPGSKMIDEFGNVHEIIRANAPGVGSFD